MLRPQRPHRRLGWHPQARVSRSMEPARNADAVQALGMCRRGQARAPEAGHRAGLQDCRMLAEDARATGSPLQHRWRWHCDVHGIGQAFDAGAGPD